MLQIVHNSSCCIKLCYILSLSHGFLVQYFLVWYWDSVLDLGDVCYDGWTRVQVGSNPLSSASVGPKLSPWTKDLTLFEPSFNHRNKHRTGLVRWEKTEQIYKATFTFDEYIFSRWFPFVKDDRIIKYHYFLQTWLVNSWFSLHFNVVTAVSVIMLITDTAVCVTLGFPVSLVMSC